MQRYPRTMGKNCIIIYSLHCDHNHLSQISLLGIERVKNAKSFSHNMDSEAQLLTNKSRRLCVGFSTRRLRIFDNISLQEIMPVVYNIHFFFALVNFMMC